MEFFGGGSFPGQRRSSSSNNNSNNTSRSVPLGNNNSHGAVLINSNNSNINNNNPAVANHNEHDNENDTFLRQAEALIPAEVRMISGCEDEQTSADVSNINSGEGQGLPNPAGRAGGACTSALLKVLYQNQNKGNLSFQQALMELRHELRAQGYSQIPQLTSSRPLDVGTTPFSLIGGDGRGGGQRRALLVGINYRGQNGQLRGCHNDVLNVKKYICQVHGFPERDVLVLMDDGSHQEPSRENIVRALQKLVALSQPGDSVFFHYSGHGGLLLPIQNYWKSQQKQYDQTLIPVDHKLKGQIRDFSLFNHFVKPLRRGVTVTCLMDACHSGSVLDLPYSFRATKEGEQRNGYGNSMMTTPNMAHLSNLCFLYALAGGVLNPGLFGGVTQHINDTLGDDANLSDYQGAMAEDVQQDDYENVFSAANMGSGDPGGDPGGDYYDSGGDGDNFETGDGGARDEVGLMPPGDDGDMGGGLPEPVPPPSAPDELLQSPSDPPGMYDTSVEPPEVYNVDGQPLPPSLPPDIYGDGGGTREYGGMFQEASNMAGNDDSGGGGADGCDVFDSISGLLGSIFNPGDDGFQDAGGGGGGGFFDDNGGDGGGFFDGGGGDFDF